MTVKAEFHFDFGSPNAYLSHRVISAIQGRTGAVFHYVPVLCVPSVSVRNADFGSR